MCLWDVAALAGLSGSLVVGADYGKALALQHGLPFIPIHHMEAHTLTVRMVQQVGEEVWSWWDKYRSVGKKGKCRTLCFVLSMWM